MITAATPLTLETLAARLDDLEQRNAALEAQTERLAGENHTLRAQLAAVHGAANAVADDAPYTAIERLSRRWLLRRGMQAAAATAVAGTLWSRDERSALAAPITQGRTRFNTTCPSGVCISPGPVVEIGGDGALFGIEVSSSTLNDATVQSTNYGGGIAIEGTTTAANKAAIYAKNDGGGEAIIGEATGSASTGIKGTGPTGVWGNTTDAAGTGLWGDGGATGVKGIGSSLGVSGEATDSGSTGIKGSGPYGAWGHATVPTGTGLWGDGGATGVKGIGTDTGVSGEGQTGVHGLSAVNGYGGVTGLHTGSGGYGLIGDGSGSSGAGVLGRNNAGTGVKGEGRTGVLGLSSASQWPAVRGAHSGNGDGVVGETADAAMAGVKGYNISSHTSARGVVGYGHTGVLGEGQTTGVHGKTTSGNALLGEASNTGTGVRGTSAKGYGGYFKGGKAQLYLAPGAGSGAPTAGSHFRGEFYLDSGATLWICVGSGTPGTWKRVNVT
jgi:hypothetical protein